MNPPELFPPPCKKDPPPMEEVAAVLLSMTPRLEYYFKFLVKGYGVAFPLGPAGPFIDIML